MKKKPINISRLELYKRVWETPVTQLAKEYGLSDVGFAKIAKSTIFQDLRGATGPKKLLDNACPKNHYPVAPPSILDQATETDDDQLVQSQDFDPYIKRW
jgi:hypothetical protein